MLKWYKGQEDYCKHLIIVFYNKRYQKGDLMFIYRLTSSSLCEIDANELHIAFLSS